LIFFKEYCRMLAFVFSIITPSAVTLVLWKRFFHIRYLIWQSLLGAENVKIMKTDERCNGRGTIYPQIAGIACNSQPHIVRSSDILLGLQLKNCRQHQQQRKNKWFY